MESILGKEDELWGEMKDDMKILIHVGFVLQSQRDMWQGETTNSKIRKNFKIIIRWDCILWGITLEGIFSPRVGLIKPNSPSLEDLFQ